MENVFIVPIYSREKCLKKILKNNIVRLPKFGITYNLRKKYIFF